MNLESHSWYLPVLAHGVATGFEYYFSEITKGRLPLDVTAYGSHQIIVRTGSSLQECRASLIFLRTISRITKAPYVYPDGGIVVAPGDVSNYLESEIESFSKFLGD